MQKPRIAVTGATGFIGSYFINMFADKYDIVGICRKNIKHTKYEIRVTDFSKESLKKAFSGCTAILHLAGSRLHQKKKTNFLQNLELDQNIFETALNLDIKNIVFASTKGVYGSLPPPWTENVKPAPENLYALTKYQSEAAAEYYNRKGLSIKTLRIAQVFGIGEYKDSAISTFIRHAKENKQIQITVKGIEREYIYVKDLCIAFDKAFSREKEFGVFNVGSGELINIEKIARTIATAFNRPDLVTIEPDLKKIGEHSLMDSSLFRKRFNWRPSYTFKSASEEIARELLMKEPVS